MSLYNERVQAHYREPRNLGQLPDATHRARTLRGDALLEFHLRVSGNRVRAATFRAIGCAGTVAAGSLLTEWVTDRPVAELHALTAPALELLLGGLPDDRRYCADFATQALHQALATPIDP